MSTIVYKEIIHNKLTGIPFPLARYREAVPLSVHCIYYIHARVTKKKESNRTEGECEDSRPRLPLISLPIYNDTKAALTPLIVKVIPYAKVSPYANVLL